MENLLREKLGIFNETTLKLIDALKIEAYDDLEELFEERQKVIDALDRIKYNQQEFIIICEEYNISKHQDDLTNLINEKRAILKFEIDKFSELKNANKRYNSKFTVDSIYFNKKY